jgi:hypothetical protein
VTPRLYVHEAEKLPRLLSPGLWPEPYRYFYYRLEADLRSASHASDGAEGDPALSGQPSVSETDG